jgi:dynein heavy chain 1
MKTKYLDNPDYNFEKVNRASLACGPLVKWAIAQLNFANMLKRIEPLRNELKSLESEADHNKRKAAEIDSVIAHLEKSIAAYKEEYASLVSQAQAIKTDLANVQAKVDRSIALLHSLSSEKERWEQSSETFKQQMQTIAGDVLLSSAFLAYAGYFDQHYRNSLFASWCAHLQRASIQFRSDLARTEYLSTADERLRWQASSLPLDDLCVENAIMLSRFNRYPLIIDPSGQATKFLLNEYEGKRITKTSFLDDSFRKNLESALRFGNPLLVQDVESYDPILNPVLNREVRKTGGRVLISLGDQDIDLSPSFCIFFSTRDPTVEFPPDLCSRVTFVNFTVTRSSLQSQCLNQALKAERPDIDAKRSDLLKLQGEFHVKLRQLEKSLLHALNDSKGKILDDDNVIGTLEKLKNEAAEICRKVEETDKVMGEVEAVSQQYQPLAHACSAIYFTLEALNQVHFLYQYSLQFFLDIYTDVLLNNPHLQSHTDPNARLQVITQDLFHTCYVRVTRGMLHQDWIVFALLLCKIHLKGFAAEPNFEAEFEHLLRGKQRTVRSSLSSMLCQPEDFASLGFTVEQCDALAALSTLPAFNGLDKRVHAMAENGKLKEWLQSTVPETEIPQLWDQQRLLTETGVAMQQLLLVQALRPDYLIAMARRVVGRVLSRAFPAAAPNGSGEDTQLELDLAQVVERECRSANPLLMCSVPGYDASGRVADLAAELGKPLTSIAIGSAEGFSQAEKAINSAAKGGKWVLLKNVHLAPQWLVQLEKKLHSLPAHPSFRLFLTLEIHPKVPVNLIRAGRVFVFEPPPGIKANLLRTFHSIPASRMMREPHERSRLYLLLAWLHAMVQERLRYCPLGWSKSYEFTESDLRVACDTLDTWVDQVAMGRTNLPPEKVPWEALCTLLGQCIYGGKIDNEFDQRLLGSFLEKTFTARAFEAEFQLVSIIGSESDPSSSIHMPDGVRRDHFLQWISALPDRQTPGWLGLPDNAEKVLLTTQATAVVAKLLRLQLLEDDDEQELIIGLGTENSFGQAPKTSLELDGRPSWMRVLQDQAQSWMKMLPNELHALRRTVENIKHPLYRYFEREVNTGVRLLQRLRADLQDVISICRGEKKQTNHHRLMIGQLAKGLFPDHWREYTVPSGCTVIQWITDFAERVKQLGAVSTLCSSSGAGALNSKPIWLGGLFNPEAFITASRQFVAQANGWSLEELQLQVQITDTDSSQQSGDEFSFAVQGKICF